MRPVGYAVALMVLTPATARAHLASSGLGPFYDGALHLIASPVELLGVVAIALLAGLRGVDASRPMVLGLTLASLVAGVAASRGLQPPLELPGLGAVALVSFGTMVATDVRLPSSGVLAFAAAYGAFIGAVDGSATSPEASVVSVLGTSTIIFTLTLLLTAVVASARATWIRIAFRVAGSWIAAIGLLTLGWLARNGA